MVNSESDFDENSFEKTKAKVRRLKDEWEKEDEELEDLE